MSAEPTTNDFAQGAPNATSPLSQSNLQQQNEHLEEKDESTTVGDSTEMRRTPSNTSQSHTLTPSRGGTLKKKNSLSKRASLKRGGSKRLSRTGSIKSLIYADDVAGSQANDAFYTPVPTRGSPTEVLANRFQVWRKVLKDLITYFRDLQKSCETRSKSLYSLSNVMSNITAPPGFVLEGGISDALKILRDYHKKSITEGNKAKSIEEDVIVQLTGLRSDLGQKIKEIKGLSGDFKNNVDKEVEVTRRAVADLQHALQDRQPDAKGDPYLVKLGVERQIERQIEEENYLHTAFLNLESSGRELESIVMGEIQKAYNAYAGILKREADEGYEAVEGLRTGPLAIGKDFEWGAFVDENDSFIDPRVPVRKFEKITYPGKDEPAAAEVKAGMLERKSKYLKSYTAGWYVLTPTHIHEFKSPDRLASQSPVMSLPLADQKLGSHSNLDSTSHKFMLKGRQSGGLHKSHSWVFRAESYDTMMAWYSDIRNLTEKTGIERDAFIRRTHARSLSGGSHHKAGSISEGSAMEEDEADQVPYSAAASQAQPSTEQLPQRPKPGGRFPSHLNVNRNSQVPVVPSSPSDNSGDREIVAAAADLPGSGVGHTGNNGANFPGDIQPMSPEVPYLGDKAQSPTVIERHESKYGDWMAPVNPALLNQEQNAPMLQSETFDEPTPKPLDAPVPMPLDVPVPMPLDAPVSKPLPAQALADEPLATQVVPMPASEQAAAQLSTFIPPSAVTTAGVGTASTADSLASTPRDELAQQDPIVPVKEVANRQSVESSQVKVPGGFPASRVTTES